MILYTFSSTFSCTFNTPKNRSGLQLDLHVNDWYCFLTPLYQGIPCCLSSQSWQASTNPLCLSVPTSRGGGADEVAHPAKKGVRVPILKPGHSARSPQVSGIKRTWSNTKAASLQPPQNSFRWVVDGYLSFFKGMNE